MKSWASPAKVNLFLRVLRRRPDGYHELASLFQTISLQDSLHAALSDRDSLECTQKNIPVDRSNLIWKAVDLYRRKSGRTFNVQFYLEKLIPTEAGLGGGSSNAATALWAVNELLGSPVSTGELIQWAAEIGSDVPFFFSTGTAYCTGRGELLRSLNPLPPQQLWVIKPDSGLSTPKVYSCLKCESLPQRDPEMILAAYLKGEPSHFNDLEMAAFELQPDLEELKQRLMKHSFKNVLLSGSGSAFTCFIDSSECASIPTFASFQEPAQFINRPKGMWYL